MSGPGSGLVVFRDTLHGAIRCIERTCMIGSCDVFSPTFCHMLSPLPLIKLIMFQTRSMSCFGVCHPDRCLAILMSNGGYPFCIVSRAMLFLSICCVALGGTTCDWNKGHAYGILCVPNLEECFIHPVWFRNSHNPGVLMLTEAPLTCTS